MPFAPFDFDCNSFAKRIEGPADWRNLVVSTKYTLPELLEAKMAKTSRDLGVPPPYRARELPSFGFRMEHVDGTKTLGEWSREQGVDLLDVALGDPRTWAHQGKLLLGIARGRLFMEVAALRLRVRRFLRGLRGGR